MLQFQSVPYNRIISHHFVSNHTIQQYSQHSSPRRTIPSTSMWQHTHMARVRVVLCVFCVCVLLFFSIYYSCTAVSVERRWGTAAVVLSHSRSQQNSQLLALSISPAFGHAHCCVTPASAPTNTERGGPATRINRTNTHTHTHRCGTIMCFFLSCTMA